MKTVKNNLWGLSIPTQPLHSTHTSVSPSLGTDQVFYALHEDNVCKAVALMLLQNAVKFNLGEFLDVWQQSIPEGMGTRLEQLKVGLCFSLILHSEQRKKNPHSIHTPLISIDSSFRASPWWTAPPVLRPSACWGWRISQRTRWNASTTSSHSRRSGQKTTSRPTYSRCHASRKLARNHSVKESHEYFRSWCVLRPPGTCAERNKPPERSWPNTLDLQCKMVSRCSTPEGLWLREPVKEWTSCGYVCSQSDFCCCQNFLASN